MSKVRNCEGCEYLNKKRKTNPCNKDFLAVYDATNNLYIRPNACKEKFKKLDPKKEFKKLKEQVIDLFQMYIRYRDNWKCCCCGFFISPTDKESKKLLHAGHFISRTFDSLLLDEKNCHAQCRTCNGRQDWLGINPKYIIYLFNKYGLDVFNYLDKKMEEKVNFTYEDLLKLRDYWQDKLEKEVERFNNEFGNK